MSTERERLAIRASLQDTEWYSCAICGREFEQFREFVGTHICSVCECSLRTMEEILAEEEAKVPREWPKPVEDEWLERKDAER